MENTNRLPITTPPYNNGSSITPSNGRQWFEEEAIEHNGSVDDYTKDDNDLYTDFLAGELQDENINLDTPNTCNPSSIIPSYSIASITDALIEGLGTSFPPYPAIIIDCIQLIFKIDSPTEWKTLLVRSLIFPRNAANHRIMCLRQTGDGKSLPIQ